MTVGLDSLPRIERDAGLFEADPLHGRRTADRDEHEVALHALVVTEAHVERRSVSLIWVHSLPRWTTIPRFANVFSAHWTRPCPLAE